MYNEDFNCEDPTNSFYGLSDTNTRYYKAYCDVKYKTKKIEETNGVGLIIDESNNNILMDNDSVPCWWKVDGFDVSDFIENASTLPFGLVVDKCEEVFLGLVNLIQTEEGREQLALITGIFEISKEIIQVIPELFDFAVATCKSIIEGAGNLTLMVLDRVVISSISKALGYAAGLLLSDTAKFGITTLAENSLRGMVYLLGNIVGSGVRWLFRVGYTIAKPAITFLSSTLMTVMMLGMIIDMFDPFNCGEIESAFLGINSYQLDQIVTAFHESYQNLFVNSLEQGGIIVTDTGEIIGKETSWPIEYNPLGVLNYESVLPHQDTLISVGLPVCDETLYGVKNKGIPTWSDIYEYFYVLYMNSLEVNSYGFPIEKICKVGSAPTFSGLSFKQRERDILMKIAHDNTKAANFLEKWWPLFSVILVILCVIIIYLLL